MPISDTAALRDTVDKLARALEEGNGATVSNLLDEITNTRDSDLFQQMGQITRKLHESLTNLQLDPAICKLAEHEIPDAKKRLDYVIEQTEQAAHKTLNGLEKAMPIASGFSQCAETLQLELQALRSKQPLNGEAAELLTKFDSFSSEVREGTKAINTQLSDVLLAQEYQDLTGQVIRRVIELVHEVENQLVSLIRLAGGQPRHSDREAVDPIQAEGPQVDTQASPSVMNDQDEVDSLLSDLGF